MFLGQLTDLSSDGLLAPLQLLKRANDIMGEGSGIDICLPPLLIDC